MANAPKMVKAVVVRGSYTTRQSDGEVRVVHPNQGKDSEIMVPEHHLDAFVGILETPERAAFAVKAATAEKKGNVTPGSTGTLGTDAGDESDDSEGRGQKRK